MELIVEVKKRGQVTLPAKVRRQLGLKEGDEIVIRILGKMKKEFEILEFEISKEAD